MGLNINRSIRKQSWTEKRIIFELPHSGFPTGMLEKLKSCDIAIGFGRKIPFEELCGYWGREGEGILFDPAFFQDCLYDSILCGRLRSTFSTQRYLEGIADEMGV